MGVYKVTDYLSKMDQNCLKLKQHINRLEGQLNAVKKELDQDQPDCDKICTVLFAASRSFQSLKQKMMRDLILQHVPNPLPDFIQSLDSALILTK